MADGRHSEDSFCHYFFAITQQQIVYFSQIFHAQQNNMTTKVT